jgi:hypothetical protein
VGGGLGTITGSTGGPSLYYYLYDWEVRTPEVVNESARVPVTAVVTEGLAVDLKVMLEGPFDQGTGLMKDDLRVAGLIPASEPFTGLGFTHVGGGNESISGPVLAQTGSNAIVDWVFVELRSAAQPTLVLATRSALVTRSGNVIGAAGTPLRFGLPSGQYHIVVKHRNHFGCMTAQPVVLGGNPVTVDLTSPSTQTYGTDAQKTLTGKTMLWAGNVTRDQELKYTGGANDRDPILAAIGGSVPTNTANGYLASDTNLDGVVKYTGTLNDRDMILSNIGGAVPTNTRNEQLP